MCIRDRFEGGHVHWEMFAEGVKLANGSTEAAGPVSYTHLDVYKRQAQGSLHFTVYDQIGRCDIDIPFRTVDHV